MILFYISWSHKKIVNFIFFLYHNTIWKCEMFYNLALSCGGCYTKEGLWHIQPVICPHCLQITHIWTFLRLQGFFWSCGNDSSRNWINTHCGTSYSRDHISKIKNGVVFSRFLLSMPIAPSDSGKYQADLAKCLKCNQNKNCTHVLTFLLHSFSSMPIALDNWNYWADLAECL